MGIFDFLMNAGKEVPSGNEAESIKAAVRAALDDDVDDDEEKLLVQSLAFGTHCPPVEGVVGGSTHASPPQLAHCRCPATRQGQKAVSGEW